MNRRAHVTQSEITRAIKAARINGLTVTGVEVDGSKIVVLTAEAKAEAELPLDAWRRKRDARAPQGH
jgi:hypothetical protein